MSRWICLFYILSLTTWPVFQCRRLWSHGFTTPHPFYHYQHYQLLKSHFGGFDGEVKLFFKLILKLIVLLVLTKDLIHQKEPLLLQVTSSYYRFSCKLWSSNSKLNLHVQSQQWKHQNNVWDLFKVNNKDNRTTSLILLSLLYC